MITIPTSRVLPDYSQTTGLEGRDYLLSFQWNARTGRWAMDIATESGAIIREGIVLVAGVSLLRKVADERAPAGILAIRSVDGAPPGLLDFHPGGRCTLVYWTAAEVAEASA